MARASCAPLTVRPSVVSLGDRAEAGRQPRPLTQPEQLQRPSKSWKPPQVPANVQRHQVAQPGRAQRKTVRLRHATAGLSCTCCHQTNRVYVKNFTEIFLSELMRAAICRSSISISSRNPPGSLSIPKRTSALHSRGCEPAAGS